MDQTGIFEQLSDVREKGLNMVDNPKYKDLPLNDLELAAKKLPGYDTRLSRGNAIALLLEYTIQRVRVPGHASWLPVILGLREDVAGTSPDALRTKAAQEAKIDRNTFGRKGGPEDQALQSLAAQIVADYQASQAIDLASAPADPTGSHLGVEPCVDPDKQDSARTPRSCKRVTALLAVGSAVVLATTAIAFVKLRYDNSFRPPPPPSSSAGPVAIDSVAYKRAGGDWSFVFAQKVQFAREELDELNKLEGDGQAYGNWIRARGGVDPTDAKLQMALRGNADQTIVITDVQVVKQCDDPLLGTLLYSPSAGPSQDVAIYFDLDQSFPVALAEPDGASYFACPGARTITLAPGEVATLLLDAATDRYHCQFYFNLIVSPGNGQQPVTQAVTNNGKPFEVTAVLMNDDETNIVFSRYEAVYAGGAAGSNGFVSVNPKTYTGG